MAEIKMKKAEKASDLNLLEDFGNPEYSQWVEAVNKLLKGKPFDKAMLTKTYEGITLKPIYTEEDIQNLKFKSQMPGADDKVRANNALGYLDCSWEIAQEQTAYSPKKANKMLLEDLGRGITKVKIRLDRQCKSGKNPDKLNKEYYYRGTSVETLEDLKTLFNDVYFEDTALDFDSGIMAPAFLALLKAYFKDDIKSLQGNIAFDPILELEESGKLSLPLPHLYDMMRNMVKWAEKNDAKLRMISVNSRVYCDSGCSATQELAYTFAKAVEYIRAMLERGLEIDTIAKSMQFNFFIGSDFFMEIAKFRAARLIWSNILDAFGASEDVKKIYIHASTGRFNKTVYDPYVNILRTATEGFSAVLGGVDSLHIGFFDELVRRPDEFSRRIARNQQIILRDESNLSKLIDPAGGSWYIESMTDEIATKAWEMFQAIDKESGLVEALKKGLLQKAIAEVSDQKKKNLNTRKDVKIGTNMYANLVEEKLENRDNDVKRMVQGRILDVQDFITNRDSAVETQLKETTLDAKCSCSIDKMSELWEKGATLFEIASILYPTVEDIEIDTFDQTRVTKHFELLRASVEEMEKTPEVFFANMGPIPQHKPRADFSRGFFEVAGFETIMTDGFECPNCFAKAYKEKQSPIVVICSTDATYPELVPGLVAKTKEINPDASIILAGYPKEHVEEFKKLGVDEFIHVKANAYEILTKLVEKVGGAK